MHRSGSTSGGFFGWVPSGATPDERELQIFHAEFGDPDAPILSLVHGFPTSSIDWYDVAPLFARITVSASSTFPGFGFSDKPKVRVTPWPATAGLLDYYLQRSSGDEWCGRGPRPW